MSDILIGSYETKEEAQEGMHDMALTLERLHSTEAFGVHVKCTKGAWGVWLRRRESQETYAESNDRNERSSMGDPAELAAQDRWLRDHGGSR